MMRVSNNKILFYQKDFIYPEKRKAINEVFF